MSTLFKEIFEKEAKNEILSSVSNLSRAFYSLIERRSEYERLGYKVEEIQDENYIKIKIPFDTVDRLDKTQKHPSFGEIKEETLDTKIKGLKKWIFENKDEDGLIDSSKIVEKIKEFNLDPERIIEKLKGEGFITDAPKLGSFLVVGP